MNIKNYKVVAWTLVSLLVLIIVLYVFEFDHIGNTISVEGLIKMSLLIGLLIGLGIGWRMQNKGKEQVDRIRIWTASIVFSLFFAPLIGSMTNRLLPRSGIKHKTVEFIEEKAFAASAYGFLKGEKIEPDGCYLFVYYEGAIHRLKRKKCSYTGLNQGDEIQLPVKKGLWGYEFVENE